MGGWGGLRTWAAGCAFLACANVHAQGPWPGGISVYGDSVARGGYFTAKAGCGMGLSDRVVNPIPSQAIANAADWAELMYDRTVGGTSMQDVLQGTGGFPASLADMLLVDPASYVVLRFGGNDAFQAVDRQQMATLADDMRRRTIQAIETIRARGKTPIVVGVPPVARATALAFYCAFSGDALAVADMKIAAAATVNTSMKEAASLKGELFIDLRDGSVSFADHPGYALDGIHPAPAWAVAMAYRIGIAIAAGMRADRLRASFAGRSP